MLIAAVANQAGFFDWGPGHLQRHVRVGARAGFSSASSLFGALITTFLSNDATALIPHSGDPLDRDQTQASRVAVPVRHYVYCEHRLHDPADGQPGQRDRREPDGISLGMYLPHLLLTSVRVESALRYRRAPIQAVPGGLVVATSGRPRCRSAASLGVAALLTLWAEGGRRS